MRSATVFIFDSSFPSIDIALPIDEQKRHTIVSTRKIEPPPGNSFLHLEYEQGLRSVLRNLRTLRATRATCEKCIVIAAPKVRSAQLCFNALYAFFLSRNVSFFDGTCLISPRRAWRLLLKAALIAPVRAPLSNLNIKRKRYLLERRLHSLPASSTREGSLFGLFTHSQSFSLPLDQVSSQPDGSSLYGNRISGWYLPAFSNRRQRYDVHTTRHFLQNVSLHVETKDGAEVSSLFQDGRILDYPYMLGRSRPLATYEVSTRSNVSTIERGICLLAYTSGYYHWLLEGVPRILDVIDDGFDFDRYPLILPPLTSFQRELLQLLGINPDRQVITVGVGEWCHVRDCVFPTAPFPFGVSYLEDPSGQPDRTLLLRLRERLLERLPRIAKPIANAPRKIYISRAKAAKRKFTASTEVAVVSILEHAGYTTLYLEDLDWALQMQLLAGAESIAGLHGAGLANILFSKAGSLLEFHNPFEARPYFSIMARELQMDYAYLIGSLDGVSQNFDNITLDLQILKNTIART